MKEMKFKDWDGKDLKGKWIFSIKIDGMRLENRPEGIVSRNGKPVYNLPKNIKKFQIAEVCCENSWNKTMSICRASKSTRRKVMQSEIYTIVPLDKRLYHGTFDDPTAEEINAIFQHYHVRHPLKYEGLVLYNEEKDLYIKVKDKYTIDVKIIGFVESTAKSKPNMLKEFITDKGSVGTGITRSQCKEFWSNRDKLLGTYIEVEVMEFNKKTGKWRHPRFIRLRPDK